MTPATPGAPETVGPYRILGVIGAGGMGIVYRARDARLNRDVAVKILHAGPDVDAIRVRRLLREARAASTFSHPNVIAVYDVATDVETPYVVTELVDGASLRAEIDRGPLRLARLLDLATQIADGLTAAHQAQIVHRDLKPENVMVTRAGRIKIVDFGLAKPIAPDDVDPQTLTAPHTVVGTPSYMSPEQARGAVVDFRSDLFSFGVILYEMATRQRPFERATTIDTMSAILHDEPTPLSQLAADRPRELHRIVDRCLGKAPDERYAATADLLHDLRWLRDHPADGATKVLVSPVSRLKWALAVAAGAVLGLAVWTTGSYLTPPHVVDAPHWRQLTFGEGNVHAARFAPDDITVVYSAAWEGAPFRVFQTTVTSPESRALDLPPAGVLAISPNGQLALSLDCRFVDATGGCAGTLARVPMLGGAPRLLAESVASADWAPDGGLAAIVQSPAAVDYPLGTRLSSAVGGHIRVSPDGKRVAWTELRSNASVVMMKEGAEIRLLSTGWQFLSGLAWAADSLAVYVSGVKERADSAITKIRLRGGEEFVLTAPPRLRVLDAAGGGRLLVDASVTRTRTFLHSSDPARTRTELTWLGDSYVDALSVDGERALLTTRGVGIQLQLPLYPIYLRPTDASAAALLATGYGADLSPDGRWALTRSRPENAPPALSVHPLGPGEPRTLDRAGLDVGGGNSLAVFAGPARVVFAGGPPGGELRSYTQSIESGPPTLIAHEPGVIVSPIAPDGLRFVSRRADGSLWIASVTPAPATRLPVRLDAVDRILQWTEDGRGLWIAAITDTTIAVRRIDMASGRQTPVREVSAAVGSTFSRPGRAGVSISRDGSKLVTTETSVTSKLFLVHNVP